LLFIMKCITPATILDNKLKTNLLVCGYL